MVTRVETSRAGATVGAVCVFGADNVAVQVDSVCESDGAVDEDDELTDGLGG